MSGWDLVETEKLDAGLLTDLFEDRIAAIRIPDFVPRAARTAAIRRRGFDYYENVHPAIGRVGITQFEHRADSAARRRYFDQVAGMTAERQKVFAAAGDQVERVLAELRASGQPRSSSPSNLTAQPYFAELIRLIDEALSHCDWAARDAPGWAIDAVRAPAELERLLQCG